MGDILRAGFELKTPDSAPLKVFERGGLRVRLDPPQGRDTPYNHMHLEYKNNSYNLNLRKVHFRSPQAHIPIKSN